MGLIVDDDTGKRRVIWALIITLVYSRYQFVWPSFRQTADAVCEGLDRAWMFFGGIIRTLIPDNTKTMILKPEALGSTLVPAFLDYAQGRGIFVDPARIRSPKEKPRVENQVTYVRESWFDGEQFTGLAHARSSAEQWCRDIAGARIHGGLLFTAKANVSWALFLARTFDVDKKALPSMRRTPRRPRRHLRPFGRS